jgi:two-component system, OmpR family, osmolarity sensor histidine kinase EnvZ
VTLLPRSLFGRLALLLLVVVAIALAATILLFRQDRAALLARQFSDTKVVQLRSLRAALEATPVHGRETLERLGRGYGARIIPESERPSIGRAPLGPVLRDLEARLQASLGEGTELRIQPRAQLLWLRIVAGDNGYWVGFPMAQRGQAEDAPSRAAIWSLILAAVLLTAAFLFARYLARPLRELRSAVERVGRGDPPEPLPESGPSEIAALNRGFNRMLANLRQLEHDRALLLAGVSHDLRTPLARLRLGIELAVADERTRDGLAEDIEDMDRIIGQFLDFARTDSESATTLVDPATIVQASVDRYVRAGRDIVARVTPGAPLPLRATAFSRLVTNLLDNALAYGAPPIEVVSAREAGRYVLEVRDAGPGIPAGEVERLKQPFTRASHARADASGVAGAGLGLAIVDRIVRLHGGTFDLVARAEGGTIARVTLPAAG